MYLTMVNTFCAILKFLVKLTNGLTLVSQKETNLSNERYFILLTNIVYASRFGSRLLDVFDDELTIRQLFTYSIDNGSSLSLKLLLSLCIYYQKENSVPLFFQLKANSGTFVRSQQIKHCDYVGFSSNFTMAAFSMNSLTSIFELLSLAQISSFENEKSSASSTTFSDDSKYVATGYKNGTVYLYDLEHNSLIKKI